MDSKYTLLSQEGPWKTSLANFGKLYWQGGGGIGTFQNFFWMKNTTATLVSNQIVSTFPYDIKGYFNVAKFHTEKP